MYSSKNRRILLTTIFVAVVSLSAATLVITLGGTLMLTPAFAQLSQNSESRLLDLLNKTDSGPSNYTKGPTAAEVCSDKPNMSGGVTTCKGVHGIPTMII